MSQRQRTLAIWSLLWTHELMTSWKIHMPSREAATPRMAEDIICVIGDVILIESVLAMDMRNPSAP